MAVYGPVRHQKNIIWTEAGSIWTSPSPKILYGPKLAVYGPVRHQKNIIWTEASEVHILFFW
jgi:hypothetical protein